MVTVRAEDFESGLNLSMYCTDEAHLGTTESAYVSIGNRLNSTVAKGCLGLLHQQFCSQRVNSHRDSPFLALASGPPTSMSRVTRNSEIQYDQSFLFGRLVLTTLGLRSLK